MTTTLTLATLPPSANVIWRTTRTGRTYLNPDYKAWRKDHTILIKAQMHGQAKFSAPVYVTMAMRKQRGDCDNLIKPVGDLLQKLGVLSNDSIVHGWKVFWSISLPANIAAQIHIEPATAAWEIPADAIRMTARRAA